MNAAGDKQGIGAQDGLGNPREIGRWARIYAQNRSLPLVAWLIMFAVVSLVIGVGSYLAGEAYRSGHTVMFVVALMVALAGLAACIYMSVPAWGGKRFEEFAKHLYDREGHAVIQQPLEHGWRKAAFGLAVIGLVTCLGVAANLEINGYFPHRYMQPVSAIFSVPFLVVLWLLMRPAVGWLALLWPALYGLHAILIVAGAPIVFTGRWDILNIALPVVGYGLLAAIIGHMYSRFALRKLKRQLAQMELPTGNVQGEVTQP